MNASRELDALIAKKVMAHWVSEDLQWKAVYGVPDAFVETTANRKSRRTLLPYSTDISAAWEVVNKIRTTEGISEVKLVTFGEGWSCVVWKDSGDIESQVAPTAPHAICLAAPKTVSK